MTASPSTPPALPDGNYVFPTPWSYDVRIEDGWMRAWVTDFAGFEFASFDGDEGDGERFLRSARAMEHAHELHALAREFVRDVDAAGPEAVAADWPDIAATCRKAASLLAAAENRLPPA